MQEKTRGKFPWQRLVFVTAILICTVMAVIPGSIDPTGFMNDKLKHEKTGVTKTGVRS